MKRCARCILPETFPGIEFDGGGVCNYCRSYQPIKVLGEAALERVLARYRNQGEQYDCIAPLSGGRDSAFVLHQLVRKYQMRTLALTVDSGFILPEGHRNIKRITEVLKVEHVFLRDEKHIETARRNTRIKFRGWLKKPSIHTIVPVLNSGDKTMNLRMARYAKQHGIPLIMGGNVIGNCTIEQEHWKTGFLGVFPDEHGVYRLPDRLRLVLLFLLEYLKNTASFKLPILKEYITGTLVYFYESQLRPKGIDLVGFWDYIYWQESQILTTVWNQLDWQGAADHTTTWRIDDSAYPLINYLYYQLVGFTEHDEMYSKMIREGQITRDEALKRVTADHASQWIHGPRLITSLEELDVTKEELDEALERYRDKLWLKHFKKTPRAVLKEAF
jgi:glucosamine--fructose-6-phosphate aminotransferase (isomerizing)